MKSSKFTQASSPPETCYGVYQSTQTPQEGAIHPQVGRPSYAEVHIVNASEEHLLNSGYDAFADHHYDLQPRNSPETNPVPNQEMEMCSCSNKEILFRKNSAWDHYNSEQNIAFVRNYPSLQRLSNSGSQFSLDVKSGYKKGSGKAHHVPYQCEVNNKTLQRLERNASLKRIQSPEIINIHRGPNVLYDGCSGEGCVGQSYVCDKDVKCDEYGFRRGPSIKRTLDRASNGGSRSNRRAAGDGMDSEVDDPELMFEIGEQGRDCPCACDHVIYGPGYTTCLQEDRFPPAPDVTRRLTATPIGKPEPPGTPPYYRSASAGSSSTNSTSSRMELSSRHWWIIVTVLLIAAAAGVGVPIALKISSTASLDERLEFASRLLQEVPLIDGHNDLPWNIRKFLHNRLKDFKFGEDLRNVSPWSNSAWSHTDLPRLKQGHVSAQFWAAYVPCDSQHKDAVQLTLEQIDVIRRLTEQFNPTLTLCTSSEDIKMAHGRHQVCSLIGVEGGHSLAGSLAVLRTLYHVGVRYLTLTSTCNTPWADCSFVDLPGRTPEHNGLTNFGKSVVKEMNRLGMIVDLSHVSAKTMKDALQVSKAPVIFSHSSAHALCNSTRNVPDSTLRKLALNKGVIMVNFFSDFLACKDVSTISDAVAHINHIRDVAGVDNVGLGAGYDGINRVPQGLEDVSSYPNLFAELISTGKWSTEDLKKLAGLNFLRVFQDVERVRDEFKKAKVPPYEDVLLPRPTEKNCTSLLSLPPPIN